MSCDGARRATAGAGAARRASPVVRFAWSEPAPPCALPPGEVHVWSVPVDLAGAPPPAVAEALTDDERRRAGLYRRGEDRARFVACRVALRERLARYTGLPATALRIADGAGGKPELVGPHSGAAVRFNVSHSGGLALLAFAAGAPVGIDVEAIRERPALVRLADRFFSAAERDAMLSAPDRTTAFFTLWTLKEAALKATGEGLAGLERVSVRLGPDGPALSIAARAGAAQRWLARSFVPASGYVGAVVFTA